jgi:SAM-dependent methyltransferase
VKADHYYGGKAAKYDARREGTAQRLSERAAVDEFVTEGPALDVACGTGAFFDLYQKKGLAFSGVDISGDMLAQARAKFPEADLRQGSVFALDVPDGAFKMAVAVRLLEWLPDEDKALALAELRRVAHTLVVTVWFGPFKSGKLSVCTQDEFYALLDGILIDARRVTAENGGNRQEMLRLRPATWADAVKGLKFDYAEPHKIELRAHKFGAVFGLDPLPVNEQTTKVRAEYWTHEEIGSALLEMARRWDHTRPEKHRFIHDKQPRRIDLPATIYEQDGVRLIIDGRHRANQWMKRPGRYPVIVVRRK